MTARSEVIDIQVNEELLAGTLLTPGAKMPGILFVHGWGGSQHRDLARAKGIAGMGCVCLTFDLRGHEKTLAQRTHVSRAQNLEDIIAAYDQLARHPATDADAIAVIGSSYGGYLATILTQMRAVRWLALRVPALYWDQDWDLPKQTLDRDRLALYRRELQSPQGNRALAACSTFSGDVLIVESEHDSYVPHTTIMSYRHAFIRSHSLTHRIIDGADHALSTDSDQKAYTAMLTAWITEMIIGARIGDYPHHSATYS
ncbi:alpha/beta fold hydrolase [Pseudomonas sp. UL073]|uniref:Alpha/beta fold hydrolase n=1 Tax=Zestomonas insulae TaxID=2809017 RepID=A0ABS2IG26_9GAMM|nr:alpha/beta fold hydrolase [Pseudomonas insulae]MBM7061922.1 alpha/beta fold hydrolase [Pseudomonas insulae]